MSSLQLKIWKVVWSGEAFGRFEGWMANPWVVTSCGRVENPYPLGEAFGTFWVWMANPFVRRMASPFVRRMASPA